ncbi:DUF695 domain-containing protein [Actibacterium ureilyticum]|uniref:DUF695 domain-containing protein n=1 Tax=Actibacterium ureilyticum TaxID=1590614 RepID=UPI000BAAC669|nr:DUF695 domain-containing protein [Actibacterium ureilyticum]
MSSGFADSRWDFYSCEIDGMPHSTMVDLSVAEAAPIEGLTTFYCVAFKLQNPHPEHRMSTNAEFQTLCDIEDLIEQQQTKQLKYIARQTGNSQRKFYFYGAFDFDFKKLVDLIGQTFPDYETSIFSFEDTSWNTYFDDLFPNAIAINEISNRAVFDQLLEGGDDLSIPRTIDHNVIFRDRKKAAEYARIVSEMGFAVQVNKSGLIRKTFNLLIQRADPPSGLDPITFELAQLAEGLDGTYDGWGCYQAKYNPS